MEETIKNRLILILAILSAIFFIGWLSSCINLKQFKSSKHEEIAKRLDAEEKLNKLLQEKPTQEEKLNKAQNDLEEEKVNHEATKKELEQERLVNMSLKEELQKLTKLKEKLEDDLKEALVAAKQAKPKK
jgi:uncharacterized membrane protein YhiD involved in acid resistance